MRKISILLLLTTSIISNTQNKIQLDGLIIDAENNTPIPFAYVTLNDVALGTVTNGRGRFAIKLPTRYN